MERRRNRRSDLSSPENTPLEQDKLDLLFNHRPVKVRDEYLSLIAGGELVVTDQDRLLVSLLRHDRLLEMTRLFTLFDKKAGKIVARYQQVFGIKALIERVTSFDDKGARNGGVIWHTTGSGKSFTMVFLSKALIWLDELKKCRVVDRVAAPDALIALISYGVMQLDKELHSRFIQFYTNEIGPFWPPERQHVDNGYRDIYFPFSEVAIPELSIDYEWPLKSLLGYISTWSAVTRAREAGKENFFKLFCNDIADMWGDEEQLRRVSWPVTVRAGRVRQ